MCFVHKPMQYADFGQILCRRKSTKRHVTSRPTVRFSQTWYQRCARLERKKSWKACCDLRRSRGSRGFRAGGGSNWPPPPVKIGLMLLIQNDNIQITFKWLCFNLHFSFYYQPSNQTFGNGIAINQLSISVSTGIQNMFSVKVHGDVPNICGLTVVCSFAHKPLAAEMHIQYVY